MSIKFLYDRQKTAITYGEQKISYADVIKYVNFYSDFLDIEKGDRSALMMENRPESIFSFFSIWAKKGIAISLDAGYTVDQLAYVREKDIINFMKYNDIQAMSCGCPIESGKVDSKRKEIKFLLQELETKNPNIKQSIFNAMKNINLDYVLGYTSGNKENK